MQHDGYVELPSERRGFGRSGRSGRTLLAGQRQGKPDHDEAGADLRDDGRDGPPVCLGVTGPGDEGVWGRENPFRVADGYSDAAFPEVDPDDSCPPPTAGPSWSRAQLPLGPSASA